MDWLIIGGGIHGVHIAARLLGEANVQPDQLRIIDPGERLLARWQACTERTGMTHLRSPSVHHLDLEPWALKHFAGRNKKQSKHFFAPPYERPNLTLFNAHCQQVVETYQLNDLHIRDKVTRCQASCDDVQVTLRAGVIIEAKNVILAIGAGDHLLWPEWAPSDHAQIHHVFDPHFDGWPTATSERVLVVGAGISGAQIALRLVEEGHHVHLMSRHAMQCHQFDSDPGWLGPKYMSAYNREHDLNRRRTLINEARHRGSVPPDIHRRLDRAIAKGRICWHQSEVQAAEPTEHGLGITHSDGEPFDVDRVLLATGFERKRPGGQMITDLIDSANLPCAQCGYPVTNRSLQWHPRIFVTGPLAELELGPSARNIAGARRAGDRIVQAAQKKAS